MISQEKRFEGPVSASTHVRLWEGEEEGKGKGKENKEAEDRWSDRIVEVGTVDGGGGGGGWNVLVPKVPEVPTLYIVTCTLP